MKIADEENVKTWRNLIGEYVTLVQNDEDDGNLEGVLVSMECEENWLCIYDESSDVYYQRDYDEIKHITKQNDNLEDAAKTLSDIHDKLKYAHHKNTMDTKINVLNERIDDHRKELQVVLDKLNNRLMTTEDFLQDTFGSKFKVGE